MKVNCWFKEEGSVGLISTFISQLSWLGFHFLVWSGLRMMWRRVRHCQQFVYETWIYIYWKHGNNLVICWNSAYWTNYWLFELKPFISAKCYIYIYIYGKLLSFVNLLFPVLYLLYPFFQTAFMCNKICKEQNISN